MINRFVIGFLKSRTFPLWLSNLFVILFLIGCEEVKNIPSQLPNPVRDFTEKDKYIIGLRWYEYGNYDIALKHWKPLAEDGDCDAEFSLGLLYFEGQAVGKSYETAKGWWLKAANQGQPDAQVGLGVIFSQGEIPYSPFNCRDGCGVAKNLIEAYKWSSLASEVGYGIEKRQADGLLEKIRGEMSAEDIKVGAKIVEEWEPDPSLCTPRKGL